MDAGWDENVIVPFTEDFFEDSTDFFPDHFNITPPASPDPTIDTRPYVTWFKEIKLAIDENNEAMIQRTLVKADKDPYGRGCLLVEALSYAVQKNKKDFMDCLLENLDNNPCGDNYKKMALASALEQAILYTRLPMVKWLVSKGVRLDKAE